MAELRTPREIAFGAVDRLCAYDFDDNPDWWMTMQRSAEFQRHFIEILSERQAAAVKAGEKNGTEPAQRA